MICSAVAGMIALAIEGLIADALIVLPAFHLHPAAHDHRTFAIAAKQNARQSFDSRALCFRRELT